jgi:hypothetical protein
MLLNTGEIVKQLKAAIILLMVALSRSKSLRIPKNGSDKSDLLCQYDINQPILTGKIENG